MNIKTVCGLVSLILAFSSLSLSAQSENIRVAEYEPVFEKLEDFIAHQMRDKKLPALSVGLVADGQTILAHGYGMARQKAKIPAAGNTVYRIASLSKLFTAIAVMQLSEAGKLDIDAPITNYLPDFTPETRFEKAITLRQIMSHRSGMVREPPVGHYFDPTEPTVAQLVESLNQTSNIYEPETRTKYSNAAVSVAGQIVEKVSGQPFSDYAREHIFSRVGMPLSSFVPTDAVLAQLSEGFMWTYEGRRFKAPTFELGMLPAAGMYSTVADLSVFANMLMNGGEGSKGSVLDAATLTSMWDVQYAKPEQTSGFGLGFYVGQLDGMRRIGHDGVMYGFATRITVLPDDNLAAVTIINLDVANSVAGRINNYALRMLKEHRENKPLRDFTVLRQIPRPTQMRLAGKYVGTKYTRILEIRKDQLMLTGGVTKLPLKRWQGDSLLTDGVIDYATLVVPHGDDQIIFRGDTLTRTPFSKPARVPARWEGLIGEYGWDHNILFILERDEQLYCLFEWFDFYPLKEVDENTFELPNYGLYHGERMIFKRDENGRATEVEAASVVFKRRNVGVGSGNTFQITPMHPIEKLRERALRASPPKQSSSLREPDLVDLASLADDIKLDIRYASDNNFMGATFYKQEKAFLQRPAAEALLRVHETLKKQGFGLMVFDAYRPWFVTKMFYDATPPDKRLFVANPKRGSRHNRGCAVDLTLYDLQTGRPVDMVSGYDEFETLAYPSYPGGTALQRWHRKVLSDAMQAEGFRVFHAEWWHFDYKEWREYPVLNLTFEELQR